MHWPHQWFALIQQQLNFIIYQGGRLMALLDTLTAAVARETQVDDSILALVAGMATQITDLTAKLAAGGVDPALVAQAQALADQLNANADKLSAAVTANTSAA